MEAFEIAPRPQMAYQYAVKSSIERGVLDFFRIDDKRNQYIDAGQVAYMVAEGADRLPPGRPRWGR